MPSKYFFMVLILILAACSSSDENETEQAVEQPNTAPAVSVEDYSGEANVTINIESDAQDSDGSIVSYGWSQTSGPLATITDNGSSASIILPLVTEETELTFTLTVTDDDGASTTASFAILVTPLNVAPVVSVQNQTGEENTIINITAEATDSDGTIAEYVWTQTSGVATTFESDSITLDLTLPEVTETSELTFELSVTDDDGETTTTSFSVTVENVLKGFTFSGSVSNLSTVFVNTEVVFEVGDLSFATTTDELGQYSVELTIPASHQDQLIKISATPETTPLNQYVSIVPSIQELKNALQDSNVINANIDAGLNLNTFNTADYVLANIAETTPFDSYASFVESSQNWDPKAFFQLSTIFEVIADADFIEQHLARMQREISVDNATIFELLKEDYNIGTVWNFLNDLDWISVQTAESNVSDELPELSFEGGVNAKILMPPFGELSFNEGGTGSLAYEFVNEVNFTWTETEGVTRLDFSDSLVGESGGNPYNNFTDTALHVSSLTFRPIYKNQNGYFVEITQTLTNKNGDVFATELYSNLWSLEDALSIEALSTVANDWSLEFKEGFRFDVLDQQERGTFSTSLKEVTFTLNQDDNTVSDMIITKLTLDENNQAVQTTFETQATFSEGQIKFEYDSVSYQMSIVENGRPDTLIASIHSQTQGENGYNSWRTGTLSQTQSIYQATQDDFAGKILLFPEFAEHRVYFWRELNVDGSMVTFSAWDENDDGIISPNFENGDYFTFYTGLWKVEDGKLSTLRQHGNNFDFSFTNSNLCLGGNWLSALTDKCRARHLLEYALFNFIENDSFSAKYTSKGLHDYRIDTSVYPDAQPFTADSYGTGIHNHVVLADERPIAVPNNEYDELRNQ